MPDYAPSYDPRGYVQIWSFRTDRFRIVLDVTEDPDPDMSFDETGETQDKVESGIWNVYLFRVRVLLDGLEVGCDYLGNSIYENPCDFRDHIGSRGKWGSYFTDMVRSSVSEARKTCLSVPRIRHS